MSPSASDTRAAAAAAAESERGSALQGDVSDGVIAVSRSFRHAFRSLRRLRGRDTHLLNGEISHAQFELLVELLDRGSLAAGELAQVAGLSAASVSQMVDRLVDEGHVERVRSEEDRRVVKVQLSDQGRSSIEPIIALKRERWREAFEGVPEKDLLAASEVLERIASVFDEREADES